jgi:hypothetical protein
MLCEGVRARLMYGVEAEHGFEAEEASTDDGAYASMVA